MKQSIKDDISILKQMAKDIYENSLINQSFGIGGLMEDQHGEVVFRGDIVLNEIRELDSLAYKTNKELRRRRKLMPNAISAFINGKCFRYRHEEIEESRYVTIWRVM